MRLICCGLTAAALIGLSLSAGCAPEALSTESLIPVPAASNVSWTPLTADAASPDAAHLSQPQQGDIVGALAGEKDVQIYDLGPAARGDEWSLYRLARGNDNLVVVLLDENYDLLYRQVLPPDGVLRHVVRSDADAVYVGLAAAYSLRDGAYRLRTSRIAGVDVPAPRKQLVYLNFGGAADLTVNQRRGESFAPFDSAMLGSAHAGQTTYFQEQILTEMRRDYAGFGVEFISSAEAPEPEQPHSTVHFGAEGAGLLGLADNVDAYNAYLEQNAIVYVESFALYETMLLTDAQMAQMVANTASHELGHLLGLYHTRDPNEIMDTTGTAWELVENQQFQRAPLYEGVFPLGYEHTPRLLSQAVGYDPTTAAATDKAELLEKALDRKQVHRLLSAELPCRCGTCLQFRRP